MFLHKDLTYKIIGACIEVHKVLGNGFLEAVYQESLEKEFILQNIEFEKEKELTIEYKGVTLEKKYRADFICFGKIIVELKAISNISSEHEAQLLNYLKITGHEVGLLINFGQKSLEYKRLVK